MDAQQVEKIIKSIAGKVQQLLPVDRFYALLYDADRATVQIVEPLTGSSYKRPVDSQLLPDTLLYSNKTKSYPHNGMTLREQLLEEDRLDYWPNDDLPLAWLGAPMIVENRTIGALVVENHRRPDAFGQTGTTMLTTIARQTAVAIENARLSARRERTIARQRAVHTVGQKLSEAVRLGEAEIFRLIDEQASTVMDTNNMYIALYDPVTDMVSFPLMRINGVEQKIPSRSGERGRTEWIIEHRQPILIRTKEESEEWYKQPERGEYIGNPLASWIGVPMIYEEQVLGVIAAYHETDDYVYDIEDLEVLQTIAAETAIALENARLYHNLDQRVRERTEQLTALQDIGVKIASTTDPEEVLHAIVHHAKEIMSADSCVLFPYDHEKHVFGEGIWVREIDMDLDIPNKDGFTAAMAERQVPYFAEDARNELVRKSRLANDKEIHTFACIPLVTRQNTVGVLYVNYLKPHSFSKEEREIIQLLCNQAAVALEHTRLLADLNERNEELRKAQTKIAESEAFLVRTSIAADFVHRANNLVGTIPIWLDQIRDILEEKEVVSPQLHMYLENIDSDVDDILRAAENLKTPPEAEPINVGEILQSLVSQVRIQTPSSIDVKMAKDGSIFLVNAITSELIHAFWSIIENGIDAMPGGGKLDIVVARAGTREKSEVEVQITDKGKGIDQEVREHIFSPFYSTKASHMGYGLWRAKNVIENAGGTITFESEVGKGTTFSIRLPILDSEEV
jgi:GAF domain-containing protein